MQHRRMIRLADPAAVAAAAADRLLAAMNANPGRIAVCLSGGSTPRPLYDLLATDTYAAAIPWGRVHWFVVLRPESRAKRRVLLRRSVQSESVHRRQQHEVQSRLLECQRLHLLEPVRWRRVHLAEHDL